MKKQQKMTAAATPAAKGSSSSRCCTYNTLCTTLNVPTALTSKAEEVDGVTASAAKAKAAIFTSKAVQRKKK